MKTNLNRKIAALLTFVIVFTNMGFADTRQVWATGSEDILIEEAAVQEIPDGIDGQDAAEGVDEVREDSDLLTGEDIADPEENASDITDAVTGSEDDATSEGEIIRADESKIPDEEEAADGSVPDETELNESEAPEHWTVTPETATDRWLVDEEGNYYVNLDESAYIGFYPESETEENTANVTIRKKSGVEENISVIVEGGDYSQGTSVSVDSTLSGNVYIAHGSVVDDGDKYFHVGGMRRDGTEIDDGDYDEENENTVRYESGWKVYRARELYEQRINVDYQQNRVLLQCDKEESVVLSSSDKTEEYTVSRYLDTNGGTGYTAPDVSPNTSIAKWMIDKTRTASANFVIKSDIGYTWLHVNKVTDKPDTSSLNVGMRIYNVPYTYGIELYNKETNNIFYGDYYQHFCISSNYSYDNNNGSNARVFFDYDLGANGCSYKLYMRETSKTGNAFSSDWVEVSSAGSLYVPNRTPCKDDISGIDMNYGSITITQAGDDLNSYRDWNNHYDRRGYARLKFIITEAGTSQEKVKNINVADWNGRTWYLDSYTDEDGNPYSTFSETGSELNFDSIIDVSGNSVSLNELPAGKDLDIYAVWFLPDGKKNEEGYWIDYDYEGKGAMDGTPVKLYTIKYTGQEGSVFIPKIEFWGSYQEYPGEDRPLFTEAQLNGSNRLFHARSTDSSSQEINGEFIARAIRRDDPQAEAFLALTELSDDTELGRDVKEEGGWDPGEYYLLAYFVPYSEDLEGDHYLRVIKKFNLHIGGTNTIISVKYEPDDNAYYPNIKTVGDVISYEDLSTSLFVYDREDGLYKMAEDDKISIKNAKYIVRIVDKNKVWMERTDLESGYYHKYDEDAVLSAEGDSIELKDTGEYTVLVHILSGNVVDDEGKDVSDRYEIANCAYFSPGYEYSADMIREDDSWNSYDTYDHLFNIKVIAPGETTLESRGNELPYGIANQLRDDELAGNTDSRTKAFLREQMERLFIVKNDGEPLETGTIKERMLEYTFATTEEGTYGRISDLSADDLELNKTIWVKAGISGKNLSEPVSVTIGRQPINIAAVCPTVTDPGAELKGTYSDDIYIYYMNPYPNENPREAGGKGQKLADWSTSDTVAIDLAGIDKDKENTATKTKLKISLKEDKLAHYELRSTAAMYIVRSGASMTPNNNGAKPINTDSKEEMKKTEIERDKFSVQFIDAKTGAKLADSQAWDKDGKIPNKTQAKFARDTFGVWSVTGDCAGKAIDVTSEKIVTNSGVLYTFNIKKALELLKGEGVSVITFYGYETEELSKYIVINEIAPVDYDGTAHVSSSEKKTGSKNNDLFITVRLKTAKGSELLTEGVDYKLKIKDNKNAGEGTVTVTGKGAYKDLTAQRKFTIRPHDLKDALIIVDPSYKYGKNGLSVTPKVTCGDLKLKSGANKDYTVELVEDNNSAVTGIYNKTSAPHRFRVKITGNNKNYTGVAYSDAFWGIPSNLKALPVTLGNTSVQYSDNKTFVTAADYFTDNSKTGKFEGKCEARLYDVDYELIEDGKGLNTGVYYYVGVSAKNPDEAIAAGFSPAVTFKKVKFLGLKFSKNLIELSDTVFEFSNSTNAVKLKARNGQSVSWNDVQVTFADYYKADGDDDLPFNWGVIEPGVNDGNREHVLDNRFPGTYTVLVSGKGRYYGSFKLTYKVKPVRAKVGENVKVMVNNGISVSYNVGGYDTQMAPVELYFIDKNKNETPLVGAFMNVVYGSKSSVADGASVTVKSVHNSEGVKIFTNSFRQSFKIVPCDLSQALNLNENERGAVTKLAINLSARVPLLTLMQRGPQGLKAIGKTEFEVVDNIRDKAKASPNSTFDLTLKASGKNYTGGTFTVSGADAYEKTSRKAKLKYALAESAGAQLENSGSYGNKNKKAPGYFKYTGGEVKPSVVVRDAAGNVVSSEYYDVTYENNTYYSTTKNPARAIVTFKRSTKGDFPYGGSEEIKFYIVYSK